MVSYMGTGMNVVIVGILLSVAGWKVASAQNVDYQQLGECFSDLNTAIRTQLNFINPLLCRNPSRERRKFFIPSLHRVIFSSATDSLRLYSQRCASLEPGDLTQYEVSRLKEAKSVLLDEDAALDKALECTTQAVTGDATSVSTALKQTYTSFLEKLDSVLAENTDQTSGGASCGDKSDCGNGDCDPDVCVCEDAFTGKRCNIIIDTSFDPTDPCSSHPCKNGGTCTISSAGKYICECPPDFTSDDCDEPLEWKTCKETFLSKLETVRTSLQKVSCFAEKIPFVKDILQDFHLQEILRDDTASCRSAISSTTQTEVVGNVDRTAKYVRHELSEEFEQLLLCAKASGTTSSPDMVLYRNSFTLMKRIFEGLVRVMNPDFEVEECKDNFKKLVDKAQEMGKKLICYLKQDETHKNLIQEYNLKNLLETRPRDPDCSKETTTRTTALAAAKRVLRTAEEFVSTSLTRGYLTLERCLKEHSDTSGAASASRALLGSFTRILGDVREALIPGPCNTDRCQNGGVCINVRDSYVCKCTDLYTGKNCEEEKYEKELRKCKDMFEEKLADGQKFAAKMICAAENVYDVKAKLEEASVQDLPDEAPDCSAMDDVSKADVPSFVRDVLRKALSFVGKDLSYAYEKFVSCTAKSLATDGKVQVAKFQTKLSIMKSSFETLNRLLAAGPCSSSPCNNGGKCINDPTGNGFTCACPDFYDGRRCNTDTCPGTRNKCGICVGTSIAVPDNAGMNKCGGCNNDPDTPKPDCNGVCDGAAVKHPICGQCYGGNTGKNITDVFDCGRCLRNGKSPRDCDGKCMKHQQTQHAYKNKCGVCVGGGTGKDVTSGMDVCGECNGNGTKCNDCAGVPNGPAVKDSCGVCNGNNSCVKVTRVTPDVVLLGSTEGLVISGVGLTGDNSELVAKLSPADIGVPLVIEERRLPDTFKTKVPAGLPVGVYTVYHRETPSKAWSDSDAQLRVLDPQSIEITGATPNSFSLKRKGKTEIKLSGQGFPPVPLHCVYSVNGGRLLSVTGTGTGNDRGCLIAHPRQGGYIHIYLSLDGVTKLGETMAAVKAEAPPIECKLGYNKLGDGICLKFDVPISTTGIESAADIFVDTTALGAAVSSEIPPRLGKQICFFNIDLKAAGKTLQLKANALKAVGDYASPATGRLTIAAMSDPPKPDAELEGPSVVGSCDDIILYHTKTGQGRRGHDLTYTHTVVPSVGITIKGAGTPRIELLNTVVNEEYEVTQTVCNDARDCSTKVRVVMKKNAPAPRVTISADINPRKVYRSSRFTLTADIKHPKCGERTKLKTVWSSSNSAVDMGVNTDKPRYTVKPYQLPTGETTFTVTVQSETNKDIITTAMITLHVLPSDLKAEIKGSNKQTVGINTPSLELEGEASDPDDPTSLQGELTRTWSCICNEDITAACQGLDVDAEVDKVVLSPGLFEAGSECIFTYTATKGVGENVRSASQSVMVEFVQGDICSVELTTRKKVYSSSEPVYITARCKTDTPVTFEWEVVDDDTNFDYVELNNDTTVIGEAAISETQDFYQSTLQINKGKLNSGSMYRFVAKAIYSSTKVAESAVDVKIKPGIKNCELVVRDYEAYESITLDTVNCEGGEDFEYQYRYKNGDGETFLGKGKTITVHGPETVTGNTITFFVKVRDVVTGEQKKFQKSVTVQPLSTENRSSVRASLMDSVDSYSKTGNAEDAALLAATVIENFRTPDRRKRRRRRNADTDLIKLILDAADDVVKRGGDDVDSSSVLKVLDSLKVLDYADLNNEDKNMFFTDVTQLLQMLREGGHSIPADLPRRLEVHQSKALEEGVLSESVIKAFVESLEKGRRFGLEPGEEMIIILSDKDVKTMDLTLGPTVISGKDGNCDAKILPGESLPTRFPQNVIMEIITYAADVEPHNSDLQDAKTSNVLKISIYDSVTGESIKVDGLQKEATICLPITNSFPGKMTGAKYFNTNTKLWESIGIDPVSPVPDECKSEGCEMVAFSTSHFTDFSTFATTDQNECLDGTHNCTAEQYCVNTVGSFTCECLPGYAGDPCTFDAGLDMCNPNKCNGGTCTPGTGQNVTCGCTTGRSGDLCQYTRGLFNFQSATYSVGEAGGAVDIVIVRTEGYDGSVDVRLNLPVTGDTAQMVVDYDNVDAVVKTFQNGEETKGFQIAIVDDPIYEGDETFGITLTVTTAGARTGTTNRATVTIIDDNVKINECTQPVPPTCPTNSRCVNTDSYYRCDCLPGYERDNVNDPCVFNPAIDRCFTNPCNGGTCSLNGTQGTDCACLDGWQGSFCDVDINECTLGTDNCDDTLATCINTEGSFTCACIVGYTGDGITCSDIDECTSGMNNCDANATCANTPGSFTCTCNAGYTGDGVNCTDIDECSANTDNCDTNAACANTVGSFTCTCNAGYSGDGVTCNDIDECTSGTHTCDANAACANTIGNFTCTCNAGYTGDGFTCTDNDECTLGTDNCDANALCTNTPGSFTCACKAGFTGDGLTCTDNDECALNTDNCHATLANCANTPGSFTCTCKPGYTGDGISCADLDECTDGPNNCDTNAACTNNVGSFTCACNNGFTGDGVTCTDEDECTLNTDNCHAQATCTNVPGTFTCACNAGYTGDGVSCTDIDECATNTDNCDANAACANNVGSFTCTCNSGFTGDGVTCADVDECTLNTDNCHADAACTNTPAGSFTCTCNAGYTGDGVTCTDIDECATNTDNCDTNAACANTVGSFTCTCNAGYTGDGVTCNDNDECTLNTDNCHANATCANTVGSFTCTCNSGYTGDGVSCTDIDECTANTDNCDSNATCANTVGSFTCTCNAGYTGDGVTCTDNDECTLNTDNCNANAACTNTAGSFTCTCNVGYTGDGVTCTDNDECTLGTDNCDNTNGACTNTNGSFTCACNPGFSGDGVTCSDIDECATNTDNCDTNAACANTVGSFTCTCNAGYTGDGVTCTDNDECTLNTDNCHADATCANTVGSFTCTCNSGYTGDGVSCTDIDECATNTDNCDTNAACANTVGSFTCTCNAGYTGDGVTCNDNDECTLNTDNCHADATCANTVGSFTCTCNSGYTGDGVSCTDVDECATNTDNCDTNAACANTVGSFTCTCNAGYTGDGVTCTDNDECTLNTDNCHADATCANTVGSFTCTCNSGYTGDGVSCTDIDECAANTDNCDTSAVCVNTVSSFTCTYIDECAANTDNCDANATCANTVGSFTCTCNSGYTGDGVTCTDNDECTLNTDNCSANAACTNTAGSFTCACNVGYTGDGVTCTDNDECTLGTDNCDDTNGACTNTNGSFTCACNAGYTGDGVTCSDIDECATNTDNCDTNAACANTVGSFTCTCNVGYSGDGVTCTDNDECTLNTDNCHANATCANTAGSFTCTCNSGYTGDGVSCTDIDECATNTDNCDTNATCANTVGSFTCTCNAGYSGDGVTCTDNDECTLNTDNCHANATCANTAGSFTCTCNSGYTGDGVSCTDNDECTLGTDNCDTNAACTNDPGSFTCTCNAGYTGDGVTCTDNNECTLNTDNCHANAACTNTPGSFTCACNAGYTGDGVTCTDNDECTLGTDNCDNTNGTCTNTDGSFTCACNVGYTGDGVTCTELNECTDGPNNCDTNATCTNTIGSFTCACDSGFTGDGVTCTDNDECTLGTDNCDANAACANIPGSFTCTCNPGYSGDGVTCTDNDECTLGTNNCHADATCTNTPGSFTCACNAGYTGDGVTCTDNDECTLNTDNCHANAVCTNTPGNFTCACNAGYTGDGVTCTDNDECTLGTDNCHANATCANTAGSFTCTCNAGYTGDGVTCTDEDECTLNPGNCNVNANCQNTPGSFSCTCKAGYTGDGVTSCTDNDECSSNTDNCDDANGTCTNIPGSFTCACNPGYTGDGVTCTDEDECTAGTNNCDANAGCTNTPGSFTCACNAGYTGNGITCTDNDECTLGTDNCDDTNGACTNTNGSFTCACNPGFSGDGVTCTDIDECATNTDNCDANATCANTVGSFTCTCNSGFTGNGVTCTDIDECTAGTDNCHATLAVCTNIPGGFMCACKAGYTGDGISCTDIDECATNTDNCDTNATCANTVGSFTCTCNAGYTGDGVTCSDIDECTDGADNCHNTLGICTNVPGTFTCACKPGYTGDGVTTCTDIDECTGGTDNCDTNATCTNTVGSFTCLCNVGYTGDGVTCTDNDECTLNTDNCDTNAACTNNPGSFTCACNAGYSGNGISCTNIDECTVGTDNCNTTLATCTDTPGSFTCTCIAGYTGDGVTCADIDECATNTDNCDVNALCTNTVGSFTCACNAGFTGNGITCTDNDECTLNTDNCDVNATCANIPGSFTCTCNAGYTGDGGTCNDIDECTANTHNCDTNAACTNTIGSFTCACNAGFTGDGVNCTDNDECTLNTHNCLAGLATCGNIPGSFKCTCIAGYSGDAVTTCTDVDECATNADNCDTNATCANTVGSFTCTCNAGYTGDGVTCTDNNECTLGTDNCHTNADCTNTPGSFTCACSAGYTGDGVSSCTDLNECTLDTDNCDVNAVCANTVGSFTCTCNAGYTGNGVTCTDNNECTLSTDNCDTNAACTNAPGSFTCACNAGFSGNGVSCTDNNECALSTDNNCHAEATCTNTLGSYTCTCNAGFTGNGVSCSQCVPDCFNVCNGVALLDCANICSGGTTGVVPKVRDPCDVCDGNGSTCISVTAVSPRLVLVDSDQILTVTGTSLASASVQCVAMKVGETTEYPLTITSRSSSTSITVNVEANTLTVGDYRLLCRVTATAALGSSSGTFTVYAATDATVQPTCIIEGPSEVDACSDVELNGISSQGGGTNGLTYTWTITSSAGLTFTEPKNGYGKWTGIAAGSTRTVTLRVCTVFNQCKSCTQTVTKRSTFVPAVTIRTSVDITSAPAYEKYELFGYATASTCAGALANGELRYSWVISGPAGTNINSGTVNNQAYQVRAGDFPAGSSVTAELTVSLLSDASVKAVKSITIVTASRPLLVMIDGGDIRTSSINGGIQVFDAVHTKDPDNPTAQIFYSWSSALFNSAGTFIGSCIAAGTQTNGQKLSINPSTLAAGSRCVITLAATSSTSKSGSQTVTLNIQDGTSPVCFLNNQLPTVHPEASYLLIVTCTSTTRILSTVWTSPAADGALSLDLTSSVKEQIMDTLPDNEYKMYLLIASGFLKAGNRYNLEADVTDVNGAKAKNRVTVTVMSGITGGEITCPSSYVELQYMSVSVRKVNGPSAMTYTLLVQTATGEFKAISEKQSSADFNVVGPKQYGTSGNVFIVEVCVEGQNELCKTLSCTVPTVVSAVSITSISTDRKNDIARHRREGRPVEAGVVLSNLYEKTQDPDLIPLMLEIAAEVIAKRTMNENSASTFLDILQTIPPGKLNAAQFTSVVSYMNIANDYFITDNIREPDRCIKDLNIWITQAKAAGNSGTGVQAAEDKLALVTLSGLDYGTSREYDFVDSRQMVSNTIPGNVVVMKDTNNNDMVFNFGESVRKQVGNTNIKLKITAYKSKPNFITDSTTVNIAPVVNVAFYNPSSNVEVTIQDLATPASFDLNILQNQLNLLRITECRYWDTSTKAWSTTGVTTGIQTGSKAQCLSTHFTAFTVVNDNPTGYNKDHNAGWIAGVIIGVLIAMILIIALIVFLFYRYKRNHVIDISRPNSRLLEKRPGSGDGVHRSI